MAKRRMFSHDIVESDAFLDLPHSTQCLYFFLNMGADDEGFVGNPKSITRQCGASDNDICKLLNKRFILGFESGVVVIKHWKINNYLQNDRIKPTTYIEEKSTLTLDEKGAYTELDSNLYTKCIHSIDKYSIEENSIDKSNIDNKEKPQKHKYGKYKNILLTDEQLETIKKEYPTGWEMWIEKISEYCASSGKSYKNILATIKSWERRELSRTFNENKTDTSYDVDAVRERAQKEIKYERKK